MKYEKDGKKQFILSTFLICFCHIKIMVGLVSMMIKKIMACIMSVCMFMSIICTENISTVKGAESTTVYFLATSEWSEVNAYVYGNAGEASTNAEVLSKSRTYRTDIQSEASGRQGVKLKNNGDYVEFTLQKPDIF